MITLAFLIALGQWGGDFIEKTPLKTDVKIMYVMKDLSGQFWMNENYIELDKIVTQKNNDYIIKRFNLK